MKLTKKQENRWIIGGYVGVSVAISLIWLLTAGRKNTGLIKERLHPGPGAKEGPLEMFLLYVLPATLHYVIAALDIGKYHWSDTISLRLRALGLALFTASSAVIAWAEGVNPFFSSAIRIQRDRGHYVITTGPYAYIRHPGYATEIIYFLSSGLALGSWLSILAAMPFSLLLVRRTIIEDRVLHEELEGYKEYAKKVRYRLIPGLW